MLDDSPLIMYRQGQDGKHWLTTLGFPALQLPLVVANQRRVATYVLSYISTRLLAYDNIPFVLKLHSSSANEDIWINLELETAAISEQMLGFVADDLFLTPRPYGEWAGSYDQWIYMLACKLGMEDAPKPATQLSYGHALQKAIVVSRQKVPDLRQAFAQHDEYVPLYLKIVLLNNKKQKHFVWVKPLVWTEQKLKVVLVSEPFDCDDYWLGQELEIPEAYIVDYCLTDDLQHFADNTLTHKVAEDYGVMHYHF